MTPKHFTAGDGCRIAYAIQGPVDAPVLLLSNSIATNMGMWDGEIAELSESHRILRYDTRGHGASQAPAGAYSLDRLGRDVLELLDYLSVPKASICGLSLGGLVAQWLGIHAPERVERLILSNTSPYLGPAPQWDALISGLLTAPDLEMLASMFVENWFPETLRLGSTALIQKFRAMILATPPHGLAGCFAVVRDYDLRRTVKLIKAPTLVIGGEDDKVTLPSHSIDLARSIPNAQLLLLPGVHMLNIEQHGAFVRSVTSFLIGEPITTDPRSNAAAVA